MIHILWKARARLLEKVESRFYIEANPFLFGFLDVLGDVFRDPVIVHVTRDPRTSITSVLNKGSHHGVKKLFLDWIPYWTVRPEDLETSPRRVWNEMSLIERTAWYWSLVNRHLNRGSDIYGSNYRHYQYEYLFRDDGKGLKDLIDWLGIEECADTFPTLLKSKVNVSSFNYAQSWNQWSEEDRSSVLKHCHSLMKNYGYAEA